MVVSQDIHKRLLDDSSLTGVRLGGVFGVAKRSLPPPITDSKARFFNKPIINLTPKPETRFKGLKTGESMKFQHKPIQGRPPRLQTKEI